MFNEWVQNLIGSPQTADDSSLDLQRLSIQLLIEVARADTQISEDERETITQAITSNSSLESAELDALLESCVQEVDSSISFHQHVRAINENFDSEQKVQLIAQMWQVAYADNELNEYEEAFIRQIAELIHVRHKDFIQQKLKVTGQR